jgi:hypothetical protein
LRKLLEKKKIWWGWFGLLIMLKKLNQNFEVCLD